MTRVAGGPHPFDPGSKARLGPRSVARFPSGSLFDKLARAVCEADCLPRKELYEAWEVARRTRRRFRGGRVVDLACGHGLLAYVMLLLDDSSGTALCVDRRLPPSAAKLGEVIERAWPRLAGRVARVEGPLSDVPLDATDVVVSAHACGALTDEVLARASASGARVAVLPCCHDASVSDTGGLEGWLDAALAIDATRAATLRARGYDVRTQAIPGAITPKNRLLLGEPHGGGT